MTAILLARAARERRILVTRDKDFGSLAFVERLGKGIIFLRIAPSTGQATHDELQKVLQSYTEEELMAAFVVIEPGRHRFREIHFLHRRNGSPMRMMVEDGA